MSYLVVIGDIVKSKGIKSRAAFQKKLAAALADISAGNPSLASPHTLTLGDEFQAVYRRGAGLFSDLCRLQTACLPARVRLSVALGAINTAINPDQALGMDGPAFHLARENIETLKRDGGAFALGGDVPGDPELRAALIDLIAASFPSWKTNRWLVLHGMLNQTPVAELAASAGISPAAVYKNIRHGRLESLAFVLQKLEALIDSRLKTKAR